MIYINKFQMNMLPFVRKSTDNEYNDIASVILLPFPPTLTSE